MCCPLCGTDAVKWPTGHAAKANRAVCQQPKQPQQCQSNVCDAIKAISVSSWTTAANRQAREEGEERGCCSGVWHGVAWLQLLAAGDGGNCEETVAHQRQQHHHKRRQRGRRGQPTYCTVAAALPETSINVWKTERGRGCEREREGEMCAAAPPTGHGSQTGTQWNFHSVWTDEFQWNSHANNLCPLSPSPTFLPRASIPSYFPHSLALLSNLTSTLNNEHLCKQRQDRRHSLCHKTP